MLVLLAGFHHQYTYRALVDDQLNLAGLDRGPALVRVQEAIARINVVRGSIVAIGLVYLE
jgi:hypothetical protein